MSSNLNILLIKNKKYVKRYDRAINKLKTIKDNQHIDITRLGVMNFDNKIKSISRQDVEFHREQSKTNLEAMIKQIIQTDEQMAAELIKLIDEQRRTSVIEKENVEVNYCVTSTKKGRKRKLPLHQLDYPQTVQ